MLFLNSAGGREAFAQVNRFYGDGLNKLEPKDVEAMPCPEMPVSSRSDAEKILRQLEQLESLPGSARSEKVDALLPRYLKFPARAAAHDTSAKQ